jgi:hypothetical protein
MLWMHEANKIGTLQKTAIYQMNWTSPTEETNNCYFCHDIHPIIQKLAVRLRRFLQEMPPSF